MCHIVDVSNLQRHILHFRGNIQHPAHYHVLPLLQNVMYVQTHRK